MTERIIDEDLYRRMAEPYESAEAAAAALEAFRDGVRKLREEHRIPETVCVAAVYTRDGMLPMACSNGSSAVAPLLVAALYRGYRKQHISEFDRLAGIGGDDGEG